MLRTQLASALLTAVLTLGAASALGQPVEQIPGGAPEERGAPDRDRAGPPRPRLFISPSGEPFRGADGLGAWLAGADTNHDGAVTLDEFRADAQRTFRLYDTNGDGKVDGFEIQAYETERVPEIAQFNLDEGGGRRFFGGGGRGRGGGRRGGGDAASDAQPIKPAGREGAARFSLLNEPQPLAQADADLDGRVTAAEWALATDRRFAKLDRDKTGRLTADSLRGAGPKK